ncbi:ComF family protein [Cohnella lubricantis]|uniref:ComF family protein n=1 Tax=Cohnella lubricantis TaxID=2163172 RepID=A0A841TEK9_9BACL|nr:ComF family protein [Cohnella lubricantis]MBB6677417.1 ComF family protein [Cohnella lubricantis]MBP2118692.1 ComF family protein [Cohnella lubricantis]
MTGWLERLHGWLAASGGSCPMCGRDKRGPASAPIPVRHAAPREALRELCEGCLRRIPWIVRSVCPVCGRPERCGDCLRRRRRHFEHCRGAVRYDDAMKEWLGLYKYRGLEKLEPFMAAMLASAVERLLESQPSRAAGGGAFDLVTSVPLAEGRLEDRGFNQAERMAVWIARWYGMAYRPMLRRVRNSGKQSLMGRRDRMENMKGNFAALHAAGEGAGRRPDAEAIFATRPLRILLIDDIYTTGSTMNECAFALRGQWPGCEVYGALWARS